MHFFKKAVTCAIALLAVPSLAAVTPAQIADGLKMLTEKSKALEAPAQSITIVNAPLIVIGQGPFPTIIAGFSDMVSTGNALISQFEGIEPIRGTDEDLVYNAFHEFYKTHEILLNILIGKAGIVGKVPVVGQPVATALRGVEGVVDTIAITLIGQTETRSKDLESDANSLGNTLELAIQSYESIGSFKKRHVRDFSA
ncbi:hypothetical protein TWF730_000125 [Orbilia blumenaviensis]|uniref:Uncharacterized protein n=1 Tax=Orbilia blumenaviensis TaxID=1796055 RepID=A0AAV9VMS2_9PEZI